MPIFSTTNLLLSLPTVCVVTAFVAVTGGLLLLLAWMQNRSEPALALWGIGCLVGSVGAAMLGAGDAIPRAVAICGGNALLCGAYGTMWAGARSFEGRRVHVPLIFIGAAIWTAACQCPYFYQSDAARAFLVPCIFAAYTLLGACELWYGRDRELISRWPTLALVVTHAGFLLARIPTVGAMPLISLAAQPHNTGAFVIAFEALFTAFCLPFLRVSMAKERAELRQRKAALTDTLTGVANRRAFFESGARLLDRTIADRRPAALLLFDLDRFKEVNDSAGHQAGDRVLQAFTHLAASMLRSDDLFARLGGEEFACLLPDTPMASAVRIAERLRSEFAAMPFPNLTTKTTVSVGVAMASEAGCTLSGLLANADRALYRAKAEGRNRVAPAPLVLVGAPGLGSAAAAAEAALLPARPVPSPAVVAPMIG